MRGALPTELMVSTSWGDVHPETSQAAETASDLSHRPAAGRDQSRQILEPSDNAGLARSKPLIMLEDGFDLVSLIQVHEKDVLPFVPVFSFTSFNRLLDLFASMA